MQFLFDQRVGVPLATFALLLDVTTAGFAAPVIPGVARLAETSEGDEAQRSGPHNRSLFENAVLM